MSTLAFCKPFRVLSQFSPEGEKITLAKYIATPGVYPAGRLDYDSEGLMLLTDNGPLQHAISHPEMKLPKTYWVQVEGSIDEDALVKLRQGLELKDGMTAAAQAQRMDEPDIWEREPPVRKRANIPTSWLALTIREGRNRQVRRMTAAVGYPTLRLIRAAIGPIHLAELQPGQSRAIDEAALSSHLPMPAAKPGRSPRPRPHPRKPKTHSKSVRRRN